jgi:hypothetical protein
MATPVGNVFLVLPAPVVANSEDETVIVGVTNTGTTPMTVSGISLYCTPPNQSFWAGTFVLTNPVVQPGATAYFSATCVWENPYMMGNSNSNTQVSGLYTLVAAVYATDGLAAPSTANLQSFPYDVAVSPIAILPQTMGSNNPFAPNYLPPGSLYGQLRFDLGQYSHMLL